jgi:hypothetical protein
VIFDFTTTETVQIAVAISNGLVALGTGFLAWKSRSMAKEMKKTAEATAEEGKAVLKQAEAAEEEIRLTRATLEASIQPWLTRSEAEGFPGDWVTFRPVDDSGVDVSLWFRNVGKGVALIGSGYDCTIEGRGADGEPVTRYGYPRAAALPRQEATRIVFRVHGIDLAEFFSEDRHNGEFWVNILYRDATGSQPVRARAHVTSAAPEGGHWIVESIEYTRVDESRPLVTVHFDAPLESD